jgi:hypothetical protein
MKVNYSKWIISSFLVGFMAVAPTAQAGLLGALVGDAIVHHEEEKAQQNGQSNMLTQHPVMGAVAGSVAGSVVEGGIVHEASDHPVLAAVGGVVLGAAAEPELAQNARDLYIEARTEKLRKNMTATGEPRPGDGCAAHHIVMKDDGKFPASKKARDILENCGIDLDSAENGVWLPDTTEDSACRGAYHRTLHTEEYANNVYKRLRYAKEEAGCDGVASALKEIKLALTNEG